MGEVACFAVVNVPEVIGVSEEEASVLVETILVVGSFDGASEVVDVAEVVIRLLAELEELGAGVAVLSKILLLPAGFVADASSVEELIEAVLREFLMLDPSVDAGFVVVKLWLVSAVGVCGIVLLLSIVEVKSLPVLKAAGSKVVVGVAVPEDDIPLIVPSVLFTVVYSELSIEVLPYCVDVEVLSVLDELIPDVTTSIVGVSKEVTGFRVDRGEKRLVESVGSVADVTLVSGAALPVVRDVSELMLVIGSALGVIVVVIDEDCSSVLPSVIGFVAAVENTGSSLLVVMDDGIASDEVVNTLADAAVSANVAVDPNGLVVPFTASVEDVSGDVVVSAQKVVDQLDESILVTAVDIAIDTSVEAGVAVFEDADVVVRAGSNVLVLDVELEMLVLGGNEALVPLEGFGVQILLVVEIVSFVVGREVACEGRNVVGCIVTSDEVPRPIVVGLVVITFSVVGADVAVVEGVEVEVGGVVGDVWRLVDVTMVFALVWLEDGASLVELIIVEGEGLLIEVVAPASVGCVVESVDIVLGISEVAVRLRLLKLEDGVSVANGKVEYL
ncbi:unnamed protein product, partial [Mesorhabditis spiculigera]